jgi:hypothetical protein
MKICGTNGLLFEKLSSGRCRPKTEKSSLRRGFVERRTLYRRLQAKNRTHMEESGNCTDGAAVTGLVHAQIHFSIWMSTRLREKG